MKCYLLFMFSFLLWSQSCEYAFSVTIVMSINCSRLMTVLDFYIYHINWDINAFFSSVSGCYFQCMLLSQILCQTWMMICPKFQAVSFLFSLPLSFPSFVSSGFPFMILSVLKKHKLLDP